ncbi:MAG: glutaredoxin domain-containing protein [Acidimicrobiales bacterium]
MTSQGGKAAGFPREAAQWNGGAVERVSDSVDTPGSDLVTVYWRPGCPYCAALRRGLRRAGLVTTEVNIWTDPGAAVIVRSIAGGNETVPTVVVAGNGLVNPKVRTVLDAVQAVAPDLVGSKRPARGVRRASVLVGLQWTVVIALVVASFAVEAAGHAGASWAIDGVNLAIFGGFRFLRRHLERTRVSDTSTSGGPS